EGHPVARAVPSPQLICLSEPRLETGVMPQVLICHRQQLLAVPGDHRRPGLEHPERQHCPAKVDRADEAPLDGMCERGQGTPGSLLGSGPPGGPPPAAGWCGEDPQRRRVLNEPEEPRYERCALSEPGIVGRRAHVIDYMRSAPRLRDRLQSLAPRDA